MSDRNDGFESRLPHQTEYWAALANRIDEKAKPLLAKRRPRAPRAAVWWARAELSPALACLAIVCAAGAWWFVPSAQATAGPSVVADALRPSDRLAERLLGSTSAPDLAGLITNVARVGPIPEEE